MNRVTAFVALSLAVGAASAQATIWRFSYASDIGRFSGRIDGALQGDGNTILVAAVPDFVAYRGTALAAFPVLTTGSTLYGTDRAPRVTLDGSWLDFLMCSDVFCSSDGFGFDPDTIEFTPSLITTIPADGFEFGYREAVDPGKWRISAVPEPGIWISLLIGFAIIGVAARRPALRHITS